jgi:hypothetical protein
VLQWEWSPVSEEFVCGKLRSKPGRGNVVALLQEYGGTYPKWARQGSAHVLHLWKLLQVEDAAL